MSESPRDHILRLRKEISEHEELYRKKHAPKISDFDFDKLVDQLADLERAHPMFAGPDLGIGDDKSEGFQQADHKAPMLSLDNTYDEAEFRAFGDRLYKTLGGTGLEFVVEPKIDGVAVSLTFEKGKFVRAVTRGHGARGAVVHGEAPCAGEGGAERGAINVGGAQAIPCHGGDEQRVRAHGAHAAIRHVHHEHQPRPA